MKAEDLITYCGLHGGCCARYRGYTVFREAAALMADIADAHGFQYWMVEAAREFDYGEFRKGLEFFRRDDAWVVCQTCCKGGSGGPPSCVRECCREHQVDVCFDCREFPCERVKADAGMMRRGEEYRKLGREEWLRQAAEAARQGRELHTGKYYKIVISDTPPDDEK
jgi:hypothetical protein